MIKAIILILMVCCLNAQVVLEDFNQARRTGNNGLLPHIYSTEDPGQTETLEDGAFKVTAGTSGNQGIYWYWLVGPSYLFADGGYLQLTKLSGTWNENINRLGIKVKCSNNESRSSTGSDNLQVGTYIRDKTSSSSTNAEAGGDHFYHLYGLNMYANRWMWMELNKVPQHRRTADPNLNYDQDPIPSIGQYFDVMTNFYWDTQGFEGQTCWFDDITLWQDQGKAPEEYVSSVALAYSGTQYSVTWASPKNMSVTFDVRYATSKIRTIGWSAATDAGTSSNTSDAYTGTVKLITAAESSTMHVAIRPRMNVSSASGGTPNTINTGRAHSLTTGMQVSVNNVCASANGTRTVTVVDRDTVTLDGTSGTCSYSSGGDIRVISDTDGFYEITMGPNTGSGGGGGGSSSRRTFGRVKFTGSGKITQ